MKILNPFRVGLLAGLGVLVALAIGAAVGQLATIITYVGAAIFLALGIDPLVSLLERRKLPRWAAILIVFIAVLGVFVGLVFAVVPVIVDQASNLVQQVTDYFSGLNFDDFIAQIQATVGDLFNVRDAFDQAVAYLQKNIGSIGGGVLSVGVGVANGIFGGVIVVILTLYFAASLDSFKRGLYRLVPATKREKFASLADQISAAVGRYVMGQVLLGLCNGILTFIVLSIAGAELPAVFAFLAFLFSLVPLVGTISGSVVIVLAQIVLLPDSPATWIAVGIWYLVYMQLEAYILSPRIMNRAVKVPGVVVVIAALTGGTLLGILGALIAIPVAAAILLIIEQVLVPRQNEL